jgi:putative transposase
VNLSHAFAGQNVGVTQVGDRIWLVTFMQYDLGYFDDETCRLEPIDNPFGPKVFPGGVGIRARSETRPGRLPRLFVLAAFVCLVGLGSGAFAPQTQASV